MSSEHGFGADHERASEMGKIGGKTSGTTDGETYKPTEHDGLKEDGSPDGRVKGQ
jgi:hypothetical protein